MQLINKTTALNFTTADEELVRAFAGQIAIAIENSLTCAASLASTDLTTLHAVKGGCGRPM